MPLTDEYAVRTRLFASPTTPPASIHLYPRTAANGSGVVALSGAGTQSDRTYPPSDVSGASHTCHDLT